MSEKMLTQRLHELVDAGLIARHGVGYTMTARGERARAALQALHDWGTTLAGELDGVVIAPAVGHVVRRGRA